MPCPGLCRVIVETQTGTTRSCGSSKTREASTRHSPTALQLVEECQQFIIGPVSIGRWVNGFSTSQHRAKDRWPGYAESFLRESLGTTLAQHLLGIVRDPA